MKVVLGPLVALLTLTGCNGYAEYFKEAGYGLNNENVQYRTEPARLVRGSGMTTQEIVQDRWKMWEQGFGVIGTAAFNGSTMETGSSLALDQANKVGAAAVVLYRQQYEGTRTGTTTTSMPVSWRRSHPVVQRTRRQLISLRPAVTRSTATNFSQSILRE